MDTPLPYSARCFAALVEMCRQPLSAVNISAVAHTWPRALAVRLLCALPKEALARSFLAIQNLGEAAWVGQLLRSAGLDEASDDAVFDALELLAESRPARAYTLRRAMEWEAKDLALGLPGEHWPADETEQAVEAALRAERWWKSLPLPCVHRLPGPEDYPDTWPEQPDTLPIPELPDSVGNLMANPLRAGIEWLHVWRLDSGLAGEIRSALPELEFKDWIAAVIEATNPESEMPLPVELLELEQVAENRQDFLSQLEVDALLKGVAELDASPRYRLPGAEGRKKIRDAVVWWVERAGAKSCS